MQSYACLLKSKFHYGAYSQEIVYRIAPSRFFAQQALKNTKVIRCGVCGELPVPYKSFARWRTGRATVPDPSIWLNALFTGFLFFFL